MMMAFLVLALCRLTDRCQRFGKKHTVSIFRNELVVLESGRIFIGSEERNAERQGQSETRNETPFL
jgi:hypothetical protein